MEELLFARFERHDFFFDRVAHQEAVDEDRLLLSDAVGAVAGLVFHGRVPPGVEVDDVAGTGEVEPGASRFQADEENAGRIAVLKLIDGLAACLGGSAAIQPQRAVSGLFERLFQLVERLDELGKDQHGVALLIEFKQLVEQVLHLGRRLLECVPQQGGGDAELAQLGQGRQGADPGARLGLLAVGGFDLFAQFGHDAGVDTALLLVHLQVDVCFDLGR